MVSIITTEKKLMLVSFILHPSTVLWRNFEKFVEYFKEKMEKKFRFMSDHEGATVALGPLMGLQLAVVCWDGLMEAEGLKGNSAVAGPPTQVTTAKMSQSDTAY